MRLVHELTGLMRSVNLALRAQLLVLHLRQDRRTSRGRPTRLQRRLATSRSPSIASTRARSLRLSSNRRIRRHRRLRAAKAQAFSDK